MALLGLVQFFGPPASASFGYCRYGLYYYRCPSCGHGIIFCSFAIVHIYYLFFFFVLFTKQNSIFQINTHTHTRTHARTHIHTHTHAHSVAGEGRVWLLTSTKNFHHHKSHGNSGSCNSDGNSGNRW